MENSLTLNRMLSRKSEIDAPGKVYIGIDFGTSTTSVSCALMDGTELHVSPVVIQQKLQTGQITSQPLIPTALAWHNNELLIGEGAKELKQRLVQGRNLWHSFKMELGVDWGKKYLGTEVFNGKEYRCLENPTDAATEFFYFLKEGIDAWIHAEGLSTEIELAVSIPASFEANQRADLIGSLKTAGFNIGERALIDEPNAAFLSFLNERKQSENDTYSLPDDDELKVLVFDFGAGTCDISILEIAEATNQRLKTTNISISKYYNLGGNNLDYAIATEILLPQVLAHNNLNAEDINSSNRKRLVRKLQAAGEFLKISACKQVTSDGHLNQLPKIASSDEQITTRLPQRLQLAGQEIVLPELCMSFKQFQQVQNAFLDSTCAEERVKDDDSSRISVYSPVKTALEKAGLSREDIDLVLLIGGSCKNPYLQASLKQYFSGCTIEIPQDPQQHVGKGAAIHSLLFHGYGMDVITPITSESIYFDTANGGLQTLVPAGSPIPSKPVYHKGLTVKDPDQDSIEIPIYVSGKEKLLHLIKIDLHDIPDWTSNSRIDINAFLSVDKLLNIEVTTGDKSVNSTTASPFANRPLSDAEMSVFKLEKQTRINSGENGKPRLSDIVELAEALGKIGHHERAADAYEMAHRLNNNRGYETNICYHYAHTGKHALSNKWAEIAYKNNRCDTTAFNLSLDFLRNNDIDKYVEYLEEALHLNPNHGPSLVELGGHLKRHSNPKGVELLNKAIALYSSQLENGILTDNDSIRLTTAAKVVNNKELLHRVQQYRKNILHSSTSTSLENLLNINDDATTSAIAHI